MTTPDNPCRECTETIAETLKAFDAMWVNGTPPRADVRRLFEHLLPKSPAQQLAEQCPHGMTEEQAQWVLDRESERDDALAGYRAAVAYISSDSWDGCSDCIEVLKAARAADWNNEMAGKTDAIAEHLKRIRKHYTAPESATPADPAPRYVFGPWIIPDNNKTPRFPAGSEYQMGSIKLENINPNIFTADQRMVSTNTRYRRAYRIGQSYPHDGGECPLADRSVRVEVVDINRSKYENPASSLDWRFFTSFTPLDEGKGL